MVWEELLFVHIKRKKTEGSYKYSIKNQFSYKSQVQILRHNKCRSNTSYNTTVKKITVQKFKRTSITVKRKCIRKVYDG